MPNRFYRPSPTQYTSQFVAEQYPYDAMLALEEKKIGRADAAMSQLGEMDVQFGSLTGGPGTQDMARNIAEKYKGKVGEFLDKKRDIWSTQTIRDLSALRASYTSDPDVKAVLQDQTKGLAQLMQIQASRKGPLDIDPNMDPETGQVRQLQSGQPWRPYQQLNYEIDWRKAATDILQTVDPRQTSVRYGDAMEIDGVRVPGFSQGTKSVLGEEEFEPTVNILTDTILEGKEGWTDWYMREARNRLGHDPTRKEIYQDMKGLSASLYDEDDNIRFQQISGLSSSSKKSPPLTTPPGPGTPLPATSLGQMSNAVKEGVGEGLHVNKRGDVKAKALIRTNLVNNPLLWVVNPVHGAAAMGYKGIVNKHGQAAVDKAVKENPSSLGSMFIRTMQALEDLSIGTRVNPKTSEVIDQMTRVSPEFYESKGLGDIDPYKLQDMPKRERKEVLNATEELISTINQRAVEPQMHDFSGDPEENVAYLADLNEQFGFTTKGQLSQKSKSVASLEAVMKKLNIENLMVYGSPREHRVSVEQLFGDKTSGINIIGKLSPDNLYHPNAVVLQGVEEDGQKVTGQYIMPWISGGESAYGVDESNYQRHFVRKLVTETPFMNHVTPIDYNDWENLEVHGDVKTPEDKMNHLENKADREKVPYVHWYWDKEDKLFHADLTSFGYNRKTGQTDKHKDKSITGRTQREVYDNYIRELSGAIGKVASREMMESYVPGEGFPEDILKDLTPYDWAAIFEE